MHSKELSPPTGLRAQIDRVGPRSRRRRFPRPLRDRISAWARAKRATHTVDEISTALGIPWQTLLRWKADRGGQAGTPVFKTIEVAAPPEAGLIVHGPCGLRIEVRDVNALAALLRSLR